jgi:hypothetical protein
MTSNTIEKEKGMVDINICVENGGANSRVGKF